MSETSARDLADRLFPIKVIDDEDDEIRNIPPEQRRLHTEAADLTVGSLHQLMANGKVEVPEFQRSYVWSRTQASRLIESLMIQCPIPVIYFSQANDNKLVVIDGNQRLMSVKLFINDGFPLQGLTTYPELNGYSWHQMDPRFRDHIVNRTIRCITILKETHPQIKFDVFERLNTGSVKLNAQELRHGINHGPLMRALDRITKNAVWQRLSGIKLDKRMKSAELALRFFALRSARRSYSKPLSGFLDKFSADYRNIEIDRVDLWVDDFIRTAESAEYYFGRNAFKQISEGGVSAGNFNSAIFDAQMLGLAETTNNRVQMRQIDPAAAQHAFAMLLQDKDFLSSIQRATSDEGAVRTRINRSIAMFNSL